MRRALKLLQETHPVAWQTLPEDSIDAMSSPRYDRNATDVSPSPSNETGAIATLPDTIEELPRAITAISPSAIPTNATINSSSLRNLARVSSIPSKVSDPAPVYTPDGILKTFPFFKYLPPEIQLMVWRIAVDFNPRNVPVSIMRQIGPGGFVFQSKIPIPRCFIACKDFYNEAERRYSVIGDRLKPNDMSLVQHIHPKLWFNPKIDRFCPVGHWSPQNFEVGLQLFFNALQVSKIAISDDSMELREFNFETWQTFFHKENIGKLSPHVTDTIYYFTAHRLHDDVEPLFAPDQESFLETVQDSVKSRRQLLSFESGFEELIKMHVSQKSENETAEKEGRPRVKVAEAPQWLFDVGNDWSPTKPHIMIETRTFSLPYNLHGRH